MLKPSAAKPAFLALSCVGFLASAPAFAVANADTGEASADSSADAGSNAASEDSRTIIVNAQKAELELESPKTITTLLDTPQTVTVISDQVLRKQNLLSLRDALQTIPGITFGAGEGGGGYGDAINLRGYSASNDITVDGVRDSAQYSRTDPFNLQQIEVYNGANSVYSGSGSVGGTINLVSKSPQRDNLTILNAAVGTDDYYRGTVDSNYRVSDLIAVRLNAMIHRNDVPGRDVEKFKRWGVAPSITIGIDSPTNLTLAYYHQHDNNTPIYGVPYFKNEINNGPLAEIDDSDYYGIVNLDKQVTDVDRVTATFKHSFSDHVSIRNQTRYQRVAQYSQTSAPQGTFCLANNRQPVPTSPTSGVGAACSVTIANVFNPDTGTFGSATRIVAPGFFQPNGPRGLVRDQLNTLFYNQTDLRIESGAKGGFHNTLVIGGALTWEDYSITTASLVRTASGQPYLLPPISMASPNTVYTGPVNFTTTAMSKASTTNKAIYAFDNLELNDMFELNGGLRWENNRATFRAIPLASYPPGTTPLSALAAAPQNSDEDLFSWRVGAVFKPVSNVSIYAAFANSKTPSSSTVRTGCGVLTAAGAADPCAVAPEKAKSYEVGIKADIHGVQLTAAAFRNERTNFRVPSNDPLQPAGLQVLDGKSRVNGIALGATGYIVPNWLVFANYTYLNGRVRQSQSNDCIARPDGTPGLTRPTPCANSVALPDPQAGDRLQQTPQHSGSLFTSYKFPFGLELGYGLTYQGKFALHQRTLLERNQFYSNGYVTQRLLVSYEVREGLTAQVNVQNLFDKHYYTGIRNNVNATTGVIGGGWATPGERRSAVASLFYSF
jgi:catecholate siderophore receptor